MPQRTCMIEDCTSPAVSRGWCGPHYDRWRRHGDPLYERSTLAERFWAKVDQSGGPDACWPWTAFVDLGGYGRVLANGKLHGAHRIAYTLAVGPIPPALDIDHTCHNRDPTCNAGNDCPHRRCCNPAHLEATSHAVNAQRGRTGAYLAERTHCGHGHPFSGANLILRADGGRRCRICRDRSARKWAKANR